MSNRPSTTLAMRTADCRCSFNHWTGAQHLWVPIVLKGLAEMGVKNVNTQTILCALMSLLYNQIIEYNYYFTLRDRIKSSDIQREFRVKPLLLRIERSQLKWFGRPIRILRLPLEVFRARPTDRRPGVEPEHAGEIIYISSGLERSDVHSSKCIKWLKSQKIFFFFIIWILFS